MIEVERVRTAEHLSVLIEASATLPLVLLKHSTRCPVSTDAHDEFESFTAALEPGTALIGVVYVIEERPLSDAIADRFAVRHESPQAFVVRAGVVGWVASHGAITATSLRAALLS